MPSTRTATEPVASAVTLEKVGAFTVVALSVATLMTPAETISTKSAHVLVVLLWIIALAAWSCGLIRQSSYVRVDWVDLPVALFMVLCAVSTLIMLPDGNARASINVFWQWISFGACYWLIRQWVRSGEQMRTLCAVMISAAVALAAFGLYQRFFSLPEAIAAYENNPNAVLMRNGLPLDPKSPLRQAFESRLRALEPTATFVHPNSLAGFLAPWLVFAGAVMIEQWRQRRGKSGGTRSTSRSPHVESQLTTWSGLPYAPFFLGIGLLLLATCIWMTNSRSSLVALLLMAGVAAAISVGRRTGSSRPIILGLLAWAACIAMVAFTGVGRNAFDHALRSFQFRVEYWQSSLMLIADHPWFGCGVGNFQDYFAKYKLPQASELVSDPHNLFVEVAATCGLPTCLLFIVVVVVWFARTLVHRNSNRREPQLRSISDPQQTIGNRWLECIVDSNDLASTTTVPFKWIGVAGAMGVAIGLVAGFFTAQMVVPTFLLVGAPVGLATLIAQRYWIHRGSLNHETIAFALLVWILNLLTSGGVSYPGVGQTIWILAAVAVNLRESSLAIKLRPPVTVPGLLTAGAMVWACWFSLFAPVTRTRPLISAGQLAAESGAFDNAIRALNAAAKSDRWSPEPVRQLAAVSFQAWELQGDSRDWDTFAAASDLLRQRDPRSSDTRRWLGSLYLRAYDKSSDERALGHAVALFQEALDRYPSHPLLRAQFAWLSAIAHDEPVAHREAMEALRLDSLNPHVEQKLAAQPLWTLDIKDAAFRSVQFANREFSAAQWMDQLCASQGSLSGYMVSTSLGGTKKP